MKYTPPDFGNATDNSRGTADAMTWVKNSLSVVIILGALYLLLGWLASVIAKHVPEKYEAKLSFFDTTPPAKDASDFSSYQRGQQILKKLTSEGGVRPLDYKLFILSMNTPNAMAVPGGGVGLTTALTEEIQSEVGLAMVIAHELGHHHHRHTLEGLGRAIVYQLATAMIFGETTLGNNTLKLLELSHSRDQETQADDFAVHLIQKHYADTEKALEFFELVQKEGPGIDSRWLSMLSTHPYTGDRIERMRSQLDTTKASEPR